MKSWVLGLCLSDMQVEKNVVWINPVQVKLKGEICRTKFSACEMHFSEVVFQFSDIKVADSEKCFSCSKNEIVNLF